LLALDVVFGFFGLTAINRVFAHGFSFQAKTPPDAVRFVIFRIAGTPGECMTWFETERFGQTSVAKREFPRGGSERSSCVWNPLGLAAAKIKWGLLRMAVDTRRH
jgi:hypothetical protein